MIVLQIETHNLATEAMDKTRKEFHQKNVSHNCLVSSVEIRRTKDLLEKVLLVEWY